jgi:hypothetical protein
MLRAIHSRHTLMHHQFFTEQEMRFADHHDWRVFFPPYALVVFTFMSIPPAIVAGWLISPNVGMASDLDHDLDVSHLRVHAPLLSCRRQLVRAPCAVRQHHPTSSYRTEHTLPI